MAKYRHIEGYTKGQPDIGWWRRQLAQGIDYRKRMALQAKWSTWKNYYRGNWPPGVMPVNLFYKMVRTVVPRLYFRNPSISIQATKPGMEQQVFAQLIERIDNKLIKTMGVKGQMKKMIHNTWFYGTSAGKLGWGAEFTPTPDEFETEAPGEMGVKFNRKVEWNQLVQPNMPWFLSVHTKNLIVPNRLESFEDTPWVAMRITRDVSDVKADPRFENTKNLRGMSTGLDAIPRDANMRKDEVEIFEIRDMRTGKVIVLPAYGCDDIMFYEDDLMQVNSRPNIYPLVFNPDDECFWGVPDSIILEPHQHELNEIRTLQMKHRRISILKILYKSGAIDDGEFEKLLNGDVGVGVRINKDFELSDVDSFQVGHAPDTLMMADQVVQADVREVSGFSRNAAGEFASGQKSHSAPTALETSIVNAASEIRVDERKDGAADVLVSVFEDTNVLCFSKWADDQVQMVMGPESKPYWVAFKPAMLRAARYEMNIDPDTTVPETKDMRRQRADMVYERAKTNPLIDPNALTKWYLREQNGVALDNLMIDITQRAAAGAPGSAPDQPMEANAFMSMMARGQAPGPA